MAIKQADNESIKILKKRMMKYLNEKFHITPLHALATMLYPRYRSSASVDSSMNEKVEEKLQRLLEEIGESDNKEGSQVPYYDASDDAMEDPYSDFAEKSDQVPKKGDEMHNYKHDKLSELDIKSFPIKFWSSKKGEYPKLYSTALWLLSFPATSCYSERNFSTVGFLNDHRPNLDPKTMDDLTLLKPNSDLIKKSEIKRVIHFNHQVKVNRIIFNLGILVQGEKSDLMVQYFGAYCKLSYSLPVDLIFIKNFFILYCQLILVTRYRNRIK